jgi:hypothetical protein
MHAPASRTQDAPRQYLALAHSIELEAHAILRESESSLAEGSRQIAEKVYEKAKRAQREPIERTPPNADHRHALTVPLHRARGSGVTLRRAANPLRRPRQGPATNCGGAADQGYSHRRWTAQLGSCGEAARSREARQHPLWTAAGQQLEGNPGSRHLSRLSPTRLRLATGPTTRSATLTVTPATST